MLDTKKDKLVPIELLEYSKSIFDRHAADFDVLDSKALGVMGIIGLLVGFQALNLDTTVSVFKGYSEGKCPCLLFLVLCVSILIHTISLMFGITKSLFSLQVKELNYPSPVEELKKRYLDIENHHKAKEALLLDMINTYKDSGISLETINGKKATLLKGSIKAIYVSVISLVVFLIFMLVYKSIY